MVFYAWRAHCLSPLLQVSCIARLPRVQRAVSNCMTPLMVPLAVDKAAVDRLVARLLLTLTKGTNYGERWVGWVCDVR